MAEVRTRDEALAAVDRGLCEWLSAASGVLTQAVVVAASAESSAETVVRRLSTKVAALDQLLRSLRPEDDRGPVQLKLDAAQRSLQTARLAAQQVAGVVRQLGELQRTHVRSTEVAVEAARADLAKRATDLGSYRSSGTGQSGSSVRTSTLVAGVTSAGWLIGTDLKEVDVASVEFDDNPIIGSFGRGDTTRADYRWAVQTWDEVVRPGVLRGMTRADFEARDVERGAPALRRTAGVYDLFLGDSDRLRLTRRADGKFDVTNGRHRLEVARELGIERLPAHVIDP